MTPPHWRQAIQNTQRMDSDGWRAWHEQRAFHRMNMSRYAMLEFSENFAVFIFVYGTKQEK